MSTQELIESIIQEVEYPTEIEELDVEKFGEVVIVKNYESTEGEAYKVYHFLKYDKLIRLNGYYCSYDSYGKYEDYDYDEVTPYTSSIILYETMNTTNKKKWTKLFIVS